MNNEIILIKNKNKNLYLRTFIGIYPIPILFNIIIYFFAYVNLGYIPNIAHYVIICATLFFSIDVFQMKYYIQKISINNDQIFFEYKKWNKLKILSTSLKDIVFELKLQTFERGKAYKLIFKFNKNKITQFEKTIFEPSEWTQEKLIEVYKKLKELKNEKIIIPK